MSGASSDKARCQACFLILRCQRPPFPIASPNPVVFEPPLGQLDDRLVIRRRIVPEILDEHRGPHVNSLRIMQEAVSVCAWQNCTVVIAAEDILALV
jgi:hypothetical protein